MKPEVITAAIASAAANHADSPITRNLRRLLATIPERNEMKALSPYRVELALRSLIRDLDYDLHKELDRDAEAYSNMTAEFIHHYEGAKK